MTSSPSNNSMDLSALALASHEVRGALAAIISHAELLAERSGGHHQSRATALLIERHGRSVLSTFDSLLQAAKHQHESTGFESGPCDLRSMIEELILLQTPRAAAIGLSLDALIDENVPCRLELDGRGVHRILSNLIENALKCTADGGIHIRAAMTESGDLAVEVEDTGPGVDPSDAERIFQPYARVVHANETPRSGVGLGLSLCRDLARAMDANLTLEKSTKDGSIFRLQISARSCRGRSDQVFTGVRILLVDDCHETSRMMSTILESRGMVVTSTSKTDELASRISGERGAARFDLVLLDLEMPVKDGWQVQDALRASGCLTPVVALTAHDIRPLKLRALECGFSGVLSKPLSLPALADMISRCVMRGPLRLAG